MFNDNERARKALEILKAHDQELKDKFDSYVALVQEKLEINEEIATRLVTTELVNRNQKKLILFEMFSKSTIKELGLCEVGNKND